MSFLPTHFTRRDSRIIFVSQPSADEPFTVTSFGSVFHSSIVGGMDRPGGNGSALAEASAVDVGVCAVDVGACAVAVGACAVDVRVCALGDDVCAVPYGFLSLVHAATTHSATSATLNLTYSKTISQ